MGSYDECIAQARAIKIEEISTNLRNQSILRRLECTDPGLAEVRASDWRGDSLDYFPRDPEDRGWLAQWTGENSNSKQLRACSTAVSNTQLGSLCEWVNHSPSLEKIVFEYFSGGEMFPMLGRFFEQNRNLTEIGLNNCELDAEGCRSLSLAIAHCSKSLKHFSLTNFINNEIDEDRFADILLALAMHPQLETLMFRRQNFGRAASLALSTLIRNTATRLHTLDLECGRVGNEGVGSLAQGLAGCKLLRSLNLCCNGIGDAGVQDLMPALENMSQLKALDLSQNRSITSRGHYAISSLLQGPRSSLETLAVSYNDVEDDVGLAFADALAENRKLKELGLRCNTITPEGWSAFSKLLCDSSSVDATFFSNHTLQVVVSNRVPDDVRSYLELNGGADKKQVAMAKILKQHPPFEMRPFFEWEFKMLPLAIGWLDGAAALPMGFETDVGGRRLSAIYQFVRGFPEECITARERPSRRKRCRPTKGVWMRGPSKLQKVL